MTWRSRLIALLAACLLLTPLAAQDTELALGVPVEGELPPGQTHRYRLSARESTLASFRVMALDESLDPQLAIVDGAGEVLISNDDYNYPATRDALIQLLVLPRTDDYTLEVSGFDGGGGRYRLYALPGYDVLEVAKRKPRPGNWRSIAGGATIDESGALGLTVLHEGMARHALLLGELFPQRRDFFAEMAFERIEGTAGWRVGILFRYVDEDNFARLLLNKRGFWRVERVADGRTTILRDWTTHPAIVAGESDFRLGLLASGRHLDILYNGRIVGKAADNLAQAGGIGIALQTADALGSQVALSVSEATMTTPTLVDGVAIVPQQLAARRRQALTDALSRHQLIPVGSQARLAIPESNVRHRSAGVTPYVFNSGGDFTQFAVGARLTFELAGQGDGGCGILFHYADDEQYGLAYATAKGELGVSLRDGDRFSPGIYVQRDRVERPVHDLLLIVAGDILRYYVDGALAGSLPLESGLGRLGIAVVNYERVDTNCAFEDFWAQSFDG